jgi:hypothetical protein
MLAPPRSVVEFVFEGKGSESFPASFDITDDGGQAEKQPGDSEQIVCTAALPPARDSEARFTAGWRLDVEQAYLAHWLTG